MLEWLLAKAQLALLATLGPFFEFAADGNSRYFWVYCLTGIIMAAYVYRRREPGTPFADMLFNRHVWASTSALNDYAIVVIGWVLKLTLLSWALLHWQPIAAWVSSFLHWLGVQGTVTDANAVMLGALLTLALFLVDDFVRWWVHYLMHKIPELWEFHKVHHSAEVLNFATAERIHPVEVIITTFAMAIGVGIVNGIFIAFFGNQLTVLTVFGSNIFLAVFNIFGGVLRHSPFWISFGPRIERWVISPAMHQIHHSDKPEHFDKNMGGSLAVWDRLFGTIHIPNGREVEAFGIGPETVAFRSLATIYFKPITGSAALLATRVHDLLSRLPRLKSLSRTTDASA